MRIMQSGKYQKGFLTDQGKTGEDLETTGDAGKRNKESIFMTFFEEA